MEVPKNYYQVLEVPTDANHDEIYHSYTRAKAAYSEDSLALYSLMSPEENRKILEMIEEAYQIIGDPEKRSAYDNARGITHNLSKERKPLQVSTPKDETNKLAKLVAANRFSLEYETQPEFDLEIEQATEFSGEFLKKIREYKNVDLPRMSDMTKVSKTYIKCIEEETLENLPALVYVRGFVYQYAKCLKINPDLVATSYLFRIKTLQGEV